LVGVSALTAAGLVASPTCAGAVVRARIATRTCDGRPFAGAGVNLKSVSASPLPASAAASLGSALAGVKEEIGSKLRETAGGRFFEFAVVANAGVSTSPPAASAASNLASVRLLSVNKLTNSLLPSRYSLSKLKVP